MWTKEQYITWKRERSPDAADWKYEDCINADRLIESAALLCLENTLAEINPRVADFVRVCAKSHMGSGECDEMLTKLGCYPDWR